MGNVFETDRSGILSWQKCPRDRFYSRHFAGRGIEKVTKSLPLQFGAAFHEGAEQLMKGKGIEAAVNSALLYLNLAFSVSNIDMGDDNKPSEAIVAYGIEEQRAIAEGLLRAWWIEKGQQFLEDFEVLEVEQEGRADLRYGTTVTTIDGNTITDRVSNDGIVLMFRPDALVRERLTGDLYIVSWKTASTFGQYTINQINSDMQSMSEVWGVQQGMPDRMDYFAGPNYVHIGSDPLPPIEGVLYLFAVKGQRRMDEFVGFKTQDTPLAYGWKRDQGTDTEWAWKYKWQDPEEINPKTGKPVWHTLPKGFRKVSIWDNYPGGVAAWIDALAEREVTPRHINPFEAIFPNSLPVSRRADEIESWRRQIVSQEGRIRQRVKAVEEAHGDEATLDREFPQHTAHCYAYNSPCQFMPVCFTPSVKADPLASGLYQIRKSNHPEKANGDD